MAALGGDSSNDRCPKFWNNWCVPGLDFDLYMGIKLLTPDQVFLVRKSTNSNFRIGQDPVMQLFYSKL